MIDVVIPVYRGLAATRRCLESVLANPQRAAYEIVVVDDASDDPAIAAYLDGLDAQGRITLLRNAANLGFVRSANRAIGLHPDRDVLLLNSDAEVAGDWLDRIHRAATGAADVGTVTPFSNNATICSYPFPGWTGGVPGALGLAALDGLFARTNAGRTVELPTAVGFCMYVRRACLDAVGTFDEERFGRGYGEENDLSLRAAAAGWRSVLAGDVFVFHEGSVSFGEERVRRAGEAEQRLLEVHPDYLDRVHAFVLADPARALRAAVDAARLDQGAAEARCVLEERDLERAQLFARLVQVERNGKEKESAIGALRRALAHAEELAAEVSKLRAGLSHAESLAAARAAEVAELAAGLGRAESLAFERAAELDRIRGFGLWKWYAFLMRHF